MSQTIQDSNLLSKTILNFWTLFSVVNKSDVTTATTSAWIYIALEHVQAKHIRGIILILILPRIAGFYHTADEMLSFGVSWLHGASTVKTAGLNPIREYRVSKFLLK